MLSEQPKPCKEKGGAIYIQKLSQTIHYELSEDK